MIHTFKFKPKFTAGQDGAILGTIPAGRVLESKPIFEGDETYWLIVVDDSPSRDEQPMEIWLKRTGSDFKPPAKP